ncbi:hypothetical protein CD33_19870 [Ureibacillus sinduriensis BLB-1 = JCM 15800]|uniref:Uncharacterized protein n=2 Tax=Ureibacillus sinduriensis TaxID=561440 RepID=A0A0A3HNV6_9BACL|nr:hypothetical protein CD33_19870 [Ureibacillus sinduriensis BLB-1 = JCM 15800]
MARLNDNLNFKLMKNQHRPLEMVTDGNRRFRGRTKHVGIDYVDLKGNNGRVTTILKDKIEYIDWKKQRNNEDKSW